MLWSRELELGIPVVDAQHKEFFRQAEIILDESIPVGIRIADALFFLDYFMKRHFPEEERLHVRSGYPKREEHRRHHRLFARIHANLKRQFERNGDDPAMLAEINKVVVGWLKGHIMILDKEFADFFKGAGTRTIEPPEGDGYFSRTVFQPGEQRGPADGGRRRAQ